MCIRDRSYIGLVTNSDTGRQLFKADLVSLALQYQSIDAISNFKSDDITVQQGDGKRDVAVDCALQPVSYTHLDVYKRQREGL